MRESDIHLLGTTQYFLPAISLLLHFVRAQGMSELMENDSGDGPEASGHLVGSFVFIKCDRAIADSLLCWIRLPVLQHALLSNSPCHGVPRGCSDMKNVEFSSKDITIFYNYLSPVSMPLLQ